MPILSLNQKKTSNFYFMNFWAFSKILFLIRPHLHKRGAIIRTVYHVRERCLISSWCKHPIWVIAVTHLLLCTAAIVFYWGPILFCKIQVRLRSCQSNLGWRPCYCLQKQIILLWVFALWFEVLDQCVTAVKHQSTAATAPSLSNCCHTFAWRFALGQIGNPIVGNHH